MNAPAPRPRSFRANVLINATFPVLPIVVAIAAVPLTLDLVGLERYGVLAFVWLVSGMFSLANIGLGEATNFRVARAAAGSAAGERPIGDAVLTALAVNIAIGLVGAAVFAAALGPWVFGGIRADPALLAETDRALPLVAALLPVTLATSVLRGAADGRAAFIASNAIAAGGQVGATLATLAVAAGVGPELPGLVAAILCVRVATLVGYALVGRRLLAGARLMSARETVALVRFGGWNALFTSVSTLLASADRVIIGWTLGASQVAVYSVPYSVVQRSQFVRESLLRTLFPKLSGTLDPALRHALALRMLRATMGATGIVSVPLLVLVHDILAVWIDPAFADRADRVTIALVVAFWVVTAQRTLIIFEIASGRPDLPARMRLVAALPVLALLVALIEAFGGTGAALALALWWSTEFAVLLARNAMLRAMARPLAAWAALWAAAVAAAIPALSLAADLVLAAALGLATVALALAQSPDLRRIAAMPAARLRRTRKLQS